MRQTGHVRFGKTGAATIFFVGSGVQHCLGCRCPAMVAMPAVPCPEPVFSRGWPRWRAVRQTAAVLPFLSNRFIIFARQRNRLCVNRLQNCHFWHSKRPVFHFQTPHIAQPNGTSREAVCQQARPDASHVKIVYHCGCAPQCWLRKAGGRQNSLVKWNLICLKSSCAMLST